MAQSELQRYGLPRFRYKYPRSYHDSSKQSRLNKGWVFESERHSLAAHGVRTGHVRALSGAVLPPESTAQFFDSLWERNNGIFFRGTADGKGLGFGVMGEGTYLTWDKGMAQAFAKIVSSKSRKGSVAAYKVPHDIKLLDYEGDTMFKIKKSLGVNPQDNVADPLFARILTMEVKKRGYDGVVSDEKANGIVIFDSSKLRKVK